jgi:hypothetical protein
VGFKSRSDQAHARKYLLLFDLEEWICGGSQPTLSAALATCGLSSESYASKRAPSTTRTSLRVFRINNLPSLLGLRIRNCVRNCIRPLNLPRSVRGTGGRIAESTATALEVVVEVAPERRRPWEAPPHAPLVPAAASRAAPATPSRASRHGWPACTPAASRLAQTPAFSTATIDDSAPPPRTSWSGPCLA